MREMSTLLVSFLPDSYNNLLRLHLPTKMRTKVLRVPF